IVAVPGGAARDGAVPLLQEALRAIDVAGALDERYLAILMPEQDPAAALAQAAVVLDLLRPCGASSIGVAHCPADASQPDVVVAAARAAAELGDGVHEAAESVTELDLGGAAVLVADA